jgi:hypothetical protein
MKEIVIGASVRKSGHSGSYNIVPLESDATVDIPIFFCSRQGLRHHSTGPATGSTLPERRRVNDFTDNRTHMRGSVAAILGHTLATCSHAKKENMIILLSVIQCHLEYDIRCGCVPTK